MNESLSHLRQIIAERRTVKPDKYLPEAIDDHFVQTILEQANWAPTHGYTEPWRFVVYKGAALARLGTFLADFNQPNKDADDFNEIRYKRLQERPTMASHVIGLAMQVGSNPKIPEIEEVAALSMAVQNMWLTAHALGLGAYWSTGSVAFSDELRNFMGFDEQHKAMGLFYLGKPAIENPVGRRLSSIEAKVRWED